MLLPQAPKTWRLRGVRLQLEPVEIEDGQRLAVGWFHDA